MKNYMELMEDPVDLWPFFKEGRPESRHILTKFDIFINDVFRATERPNLLIRVIPEPASRNVKNALQ